MRFFFNQNSFILTLTQYWFWCWLGAVQATSIVRTNVHIVIDIYTSYVRNELTKQWRVKTQTGFPVKNALIDTPLQWRHKALHHWPLCGEFTGTGEFPPQMATNAENMSIWWRHHAFMERECPFIISQVSDYTDIRLHSWKYSFFLLES